MSEAKPAFAPTYEEAVRLAAPYCKAMVEADQALSRTEYLEEPLRYHLLEREHMRCASEAWAVQQMVSALFGVSEEQVGSDVMRAAGIEE